MCIESFEFKSCGLIENDPLYDSNYLVTFLKLLCYELYEIELLDYLKFLLCVLVYEFSELYVNMPI